MERGRKGRLQSYAFKRRIRQGLLAVLRTVFLTCLCYLFLFPIFYMLLAALSEPSSLQNPNVVWIPGEWTLRCFKYAIREIRFWQSSGISMVHAVGGTLASLVSCSLVGYGLARYKFAEKGLVFFCVVLTIIVPPQILLISQYLQYQDFLGLELLNTPLVFILPALFGAGLRNGLFIFIFRQFFLGLPKDLEEVAWVDGCSPLGTFVRIILPISGPGIVTVTLFSFVWHWNDYYYSAMLYTTRIKALIPMMQSVKGALAGNSLYARGIVASAGLLTLIVPMTLYLVLQRQFVESIERTGIVG